MPLRPYMAPLPKPATPKAVVELLSEEPREHIPIGSDIELAAYIDQEADGGGGGTFDGGEVTGQTEFVIPTGLGAPGSAVIFQQPNAPTDFAFTVQAPEVGNENSESRWLMAHPEGGICVSSWTEPEWAQLHLYKYKTAQAKPILRCTSSLVDGHDDLFAVGKDGNVLIRIDPAQTISDPLTIQDHDAGTRLVVPQSGQFYGPAARDLDAAASGVIAQTAPSYLASGAYDMASSGEMRAVRINLLKGDVLTKVGTTHAGGAAGLTLAKFGLYDSAFNLVTSTADLSATINGEAAGYHEYGLSGSYTVPSSGAYYIAFLPVGTTAPSLSRAFSGNDVPVNGIYQSWRSTGLSDLPDPSGHASGNIAAYLTVA